MKYIRIAMTTLSVIILAGYLKAQIFENYSVYSLAPGYSFSEDEGLRGFTLTAHGQAGSGFFHGELSSTLGYGKELFMNEYLTLDIAAGIPFTINDNSEALIALSPVSINLTTEPSLGMATLLKYRYGLTVFETKLMIVDYSKNDIPFLSNKSYFSIKRRLGDVFGIGVRYTSFTATDHMLSLVLFAGFEDN